MHIISIDIGGTKIEGAIIKFYVKNNKIRYKTFDDVLISTKASQGRKAIINRVISVIRYLIRKEKELSNGLLHSRNIKTIKPIIGISMPGFCDKTGKVVFAGNVLRCLEGLNIIRSIKRYIGDYNIIIENDANCFTLAESIFGVARNKNIVIGVIWGSGIGAGLVIDKRIYHGSVGGACEFGHLVINDKEIESLASGKAIEECYNQLQDIEGIAATQEISAIDIFRLRNNLAKKCIKRSIHYLALGVSYLINIINPDIVVLGGGVSNCPKRYLKELEKETKKYCIKSLIKNLEIRKYKIKTNPCLIGAAYLAYQNFNGRFNGL